MRIVSGILEMLELEEKLCQVIGKSYLESVPFPPQDGLILIYKFWCIKGKILMVKDYDEQNISPTVIDYDVLEKALNNVKRRSKLFYLIKRVVKSWGHWKELPRGKPRRFT